jgi:hypothetical protein
VVDLLRAAGKDGVLRVERDRQGAVRVFPGARLTPPITGLPVDEPDGDETVDVSATESVDGESEIEGTWRPASAGPEVIAEPPIVDAETVAAAEETTVEDVVSEPAGRKGARKRKTAAPKTNGKAKAAKPRARKAARAKSEAADKD